MFTFEVSKANKSYDIQVYQLFPRINLWSSGRLNDQCRHGNILTDMKRLWATICVNTVPKLSADNADSSKFLLKKKLKKRNELLSEGTAAHTLVNCFQKQPQHTLSTSLCQEAVNSPHPFFSFSFFWCGGGSYAKQPPPPKNWQNIQANKCH